MHAGVTARRVIAAADHGAGEMAVAHQRRGGSGWPGQGTNAPVLHGRRDVSVSR